MLLHETGNRHIHAFACARDLLVEDRHHRRRPEARAHVEGNLLRRYRIAEESEPEKITRPIRAPAFDGIERIRFEYLERRDGLGLDGSRRPVELHCEGDGRTPSDGLLQSAANAGIIGTKELDLLAAPLLAFAQRRR